MNTNEINESEFFEENDLYVEGKIFKKTIEKISLEFDELQNLFSSMSEKEKEEIVKSTDTNDIQIKNLESEIEEIIEQTTNNISKNKKKQLFILDSKDNYDELSGHKKNNYLRNEAKVLEETIKSITLPSYQEIKQKKFMNCKLNSYHFFKNICKKEVGKENNYIFNYRDSFLNDMTKIDQLFFKDYFKPNIVPKELSDLLVYEFSVYHPTKNVKTQQIAILSNGKLSNLKDKIYCVLDEIQSTPQRSFFFIENTFYNFIPKNNFGASSLPLSNSIAENRIKKLSISDLQYKDTCINNEEDIIIDDSNHKTKFNYEKSLYSSGLTKDSKAKNQYEDLMMEDFTLDLIPMRIGYPYLFRHIEYCDHMIILNDIRRIDQYDNFNIEGGVIKEDNFAVVTYQKKLKRRKCDACLFYYAKFISVNDLTMGDVSHALFLCDYCLRKLHAKDLNERNKSNIKLIPYFHD